THLANLSLSVNGLQVADKNAPMKNLFSVDAMSFALEPVPLLSKKVIIDEMTVTGIRYGTARKTSGALPPRKAAKVEKSWLSAESPLGKMAGKVSERAKSKAAGLPALSAIASAKEQLKTTNLQGLVKAENLPMLKDLDAMKTGYQQKSADYQAKVKSLKVQETLASVGPAWNDVQALKIQNAQDLISAKDKIDRLNKCRQDLQTASDTLKTLKAQAEADFGDQKNLLAKIEELKNRDLQAVGQLLKLPTFDFSSLTGVILGPVWMERLDRALDLIAKARTYMPTSKGKTKKSAPITQPRLHGVDVRFPVFNRPPDFWIKHIAVSGTTGGDGKPNQPLDFSGTITDVTSDPALLGSPVRVDLKGAQGAHRLVVQAVLNHTQEIPVDTLQVEMAGLRAEELHLPSSEYLPAFQGGNAAVTAGLTLTGNEFAAQMNLALTGLAKANTAKPTGLGSAAEIAASLWSGIDALHFGAEGKGSPDKFDLTIHSDLDKILSERMQKLLGQELAGVQAKVKAEIEKLVAGKQSDLLASYGADKGGVLGSLAGQQKELTEKIASIQKLIKEKQDVGAGATNQQTEQLKNKAQDQLKGLFGR
ncbi:MAG: TIGR03545 family protein, partial [Candidatus Firestonebacteria bacterium]|nr:TIGR03545 family protein [Candidatus Firestonebacteria bacterium]